MISIIIPTRNRLAYLKECLSSVIAQSYQDWEIVVVDEASDLPTRTYLSSLEDSRIKTHRNDPPLQAAGARNIGAHLATGEIFVFLDDDDLFLPGRLEATARAFASRPETGVVLAPMDCQNFTVRFDLEGEVFEKLTSTFHTLPTSCLAVRRALFEQLGGFDEAMTPSEDLEFCLRAAKVTKFHSLDALYVFHRQHSQGRLIDNQESAMKSFSAMLRKNLPDGKGGWSKQGERLFRSWRAQGFTGSARRHMQAGDKGRAALESFRAWQCEPFVLKRFLRFCAYAFAPRYIVGKLIDHRATDLTI